MKEQHPIDDLFARVLRDAEADPPPRVWAGIARERGAARAGLLRRWGWIPLLLLLGSGIGYALVYTGSTGGQTAEAIAPQGTPPAMPPTEATVPGTVPGTVEPPAPEKEPATTASAKETAYRAAGHAALEATAPVAGISPSSTPGNAHGETRNAASGRSATPTDAMLVASVVRPGSTGTAGSAEAARATTAAVPIEKPEHAAVMHQAVTSSAPNRPTSTSGGETQPLHSVSTVSSGLSKEASVQAFPLPLRLSYTGPGPAAPELLAAPSLTFAGPQQTWWIAATAGTFRENRTWKGGNKELRDALQGTEIPHPTVAVGLLGGVNGRGGWSLATGVEYHAGRFNFNHADRFRTRHDSIVNYVVTFNSLVVETYTDTISTFREEQRTIAAMNRYTTLRIPVELAWHTAYRRFRAGARAGLALELSTLRSGATLLRNEEGLQGVYILPDNRRCMSILGGSLAADFGYLLTDHWGLWASPVYEAGILSFFPADTGPYALPERMGIRFRLAYTLRP